MNSVLPIGLLALAGFLVGGAWSTYRNGGSRPVVGVLGALAVLSLAAGLLWLGGD